MKPLRFAEGIVLGASLLLASVAFAGEKANVRLYEDVKVNGKNLAQGSYQLAWEGTGGTVQVSIRQGKDTIATVPAQIENSAAAASATGYSTKKADDGSRELTGVFFGGKRYSLNLDQQAAATAAPAVATPGNK